MEEDWRELIRSSNSRKRMDERLAELIENADAGDADAMIAVGDCFERGQYAEKDAVRAFLYYKKAANRGDARGEYKVGISFLEGIGTAKDESRGWEYIFRAADQGIAAAQYLAGCYCRREDIDLQDQGNNRALQYYQAAAHKGFAAAQVEIGLSHLTGKNPSVDNGLFWLLCAYMHGENSLRESERAKDIVNDYMDHMRNLGHPEVRERVDRIMEDINENYSQYIQNP